MISRYARPEMSRLWSDSHKYLTWLKVEYAVCEQMAKDRVIPLKDWRVLKPALLKLIKSGGVKPERVLEIEKVVKHDILAFTTAVAEKVGPTSRYVHFGLTSSDVLDTGLSLQIQESRELILKSVAELLKALKAKAVQFKKTPTIGRSHGIFAEPTSFGLKFLGAYQEWQRHLNRLTQAFDNLNYGKISGAVGVNAHWSPEFEKKVLKQLKLNREKVSTQVLPRDRHAQYLSALALAGTGIERLALEFRHLQRSEVGEVIENFSKGQKGSSSMPHKRNPISGENLTGCARLLRGYLHPGLESVALWHERDISHSSVERVALVDATILFDYALNRLIGLVKGLGVEKSRVSQNLEAAGVLSFSGHFLLELVKKGVTREDAYAWVQECALSSLKGGNFLTKLSQHPEIKAHLSASEIKKLGSLKYQLRHVDHIYREAIK